MSGESQSGVAGGPANPLGRFNSTREIASYFDRWAPTYESDMTVEYGWVGPQALVGFASEFMDPSHVVLDAGAGTGLVGRLLIQLGYQRIVAVDASAGMLEIARTRDIYEASYCLPLGRDNSVFDIDTFDGALASGLFASTRNAPAVFRELVDAVRSGGLIGFDAPTASDDETRALHREISAFERSGRIEAIQQSPPIRLLPRLPEGLESVIYVYRAQ